MSTSGYSLSRRWWDWCFQHQGHHAPAHSALYHWYVEWCNRCGWPDEFEMDPRYAMCAIGVRSYNTYKDTLIDLINWGFVRLIRKGANQHAPWLLALSNFDEPLNNPSDNPSDKAGDKAGSAVSNFDNPLNKARNKAHDNPRDKAGDKADSALSNFDNPRDTHTINNNLFPFSSTPDGEKGGSKKKSGDPGTGSGASPPPTPPPDGSNRFELLRMGLHHDPDFIRPLAGVVRIPEARIPRLIDTYFLEQRGKGKLTGERTDADIRTHCFDWIRKHLEINQPQQQGHERSQRRTIPAAPGGAAAGPGGEIIDAGKYAGRVNTYRRPRNSNSGNAG